MTVTRSSRTERVTAFSPFYFTFLDLKLFCEIDIGLAAISYLDRKKLRGYFGRTMFTKFIRSKKSKVPYLLFYLLSQNSCFSLDLELKDEIAAYKKGHYAEVIQIGKSLAAVSDHSDLVHYYLANAYSQLKFQKEALQEYSICIKETKNPKILSYSKTAQFVLEQVELASSAKSNGKKAVLTSGVSEAREHIKELKERLIEDEQAKLKLLAKEVDQRIKKVNDESQADIDSVPKTWLSITDRSPSYNPLEQAQVDTIKESCKNKIYAINEEYTRCRHAINASYKLQIDELENSLNNLISASKPGTTDIQLVPQQSNLYVRNYTNYAEEVPVPPVIQELKAVPRSLAAEREHVPVNKKRLK